MLFQINRSIDYLCVYLSAISLVLYCPLLHHIIMKIRQNREVRAAEKYIILNKIR